MDNDEEHRAGESHSPTKTPRQHDERKVDEATAKKRLEQAQEEAGEARKEGGYQ